MQIIEGERERVGINMQIVIMAEVVYTDARERLTCV
jgi:hypothetical protein